MFKFLHNYDITIIERPAFTKMIGEIKTIRLNNDYIVEIDVEHLTAHIIKLKKEETKMSMLSEKRHEIQAKLDAIMQSRKATIESKVQAYRTQLESEALTAEAIKLKNVLAAIDAVIAYDESYVPQVQRPIVEPAVKAEPLAETVEFQHAQPMQEAVIKPAVAPVEEVVAPISMVEAAPAVNTIPAGEVISTPTEGRPGMATINIPNRG